MSTEAKTAAGAQSLDAEAPKSADGKDETVTLNVGGRVFTTTRRTLGRDGERNLLLALLDDANRLQRTQLPDGTLFFDRDPELFAQLLAYLRGNDAAVSGLPQTAQRTLLAEAQFYGLGGLADLLYPPLSEERRAALLDTCLAFLGVLPFFGPVAALRNGPLAEAYEQLVRLSGDRPRVAALVNTYLDSIQGRQRFGHSTYVCNQHDLATGPEAITEILCQLLDELDPAERKRTDDAALFGDPNDDDGRGVGPQARSRRRPVLSALQSCVIGALQQRTVRMPEVPRPPAPYLGGLLSPLQPTTWAASIAPLGTPMPTMPLLTELARAADRQRDARTKCHWRAVRVVLWVTKRGWQWGARLVRGRMAAGRQLALHLYLDWLEL